MSKSLVLDGEEFILADEGSDDSYKVFNSYMAKKLYVGNLSYSTTSDGLKAGNVISASVLTDKMTGRSRGFGFVEMEDADAENAISMFDGKDFDGRNIKVNEARPMEERPPRRDFGPRRSF